MPARKIPKNYRNVTGRFTTSKTKDIITFESKLEKDFYYLFDFDNTVLEIEDQPFKIEYYYDGKERSYTPDVYLKTIPGQPNIIGEVKYHEDLKENRELYRPKFEAARMFCDTLPEPTQFMLFTNRCSRIKNRDYLFNMHFLHDYKSLFMYDYETAVQIYEDGMTIEEMLNIYSDDKMKQMQYIKAIWAMIRRKIMLVDLTKKLGYKTVIGCIRNYNEDLYELSRKGQIKEGYLL